MESKTVVIVGGCSGTGLALAKKVASKGAQVIVASRSAQKHAQTLGKESWAKNVTFFSVDITRETDIQAFFAELPPVDHIAITVKAPIVAKPLIDLDIMEVRQAFETKLWGQYLVAKSAHQHIKAGGSIVLSSGTLAQRPIQDYSTLSIINGAVESLCRSLALEFSPIRVNAVAPGFTTLQSMGDKVPLGLGEYEQIANAYLFFMEDTYTTGVVMATDGGAKLI